jgi:two-component system, response regulator PdtaR
MSIVVPTNIPSSDPASPAPTLAGVCVLIAEDEFLLAAQLEDELHAVGCTTLGPYTSVARATQACREAQFDVALLDVNLHGEMVYPVADELRVRGIPFVLLSGYGASNMPERFRNVPRVAKPYEPTFLLREIRRAIAK